MSTRPAAIPPRIDVRETMRLAERAAASDGEEDALAAVAAAARITDDARLWHWTGLFERAIDRRNRALPAFERVRALSPEDAVAAHALARTRLEAGLPAVAAFEVAHTLAPLDGDVLLGLAAAQLAEGAVEDAIGGLSDQCDRHPGWFAGHAELARIRWAYGAREEAVASFDRALTVAPRDPALWREKIAVLVAASRWDAALATIAQARAAIGGSEVLTGFEAAILSEIGDHAAADAAFAATTNLRDPATEVRRVRHALRLGRTDGAAAVVERALARPGAEAMWPYAALVWRLLGNPRAAWLDAGGPVRIEDIGADLPPLDRLATLLNARHDHGGEQFDQSVRGGSQTSGVLLARIEPELMAVREAIGRAVARYVAALPGPDPKHPTLSARRDAPVRLAGSWSVRLPAGGCHANHIHSAGWISSALYVAVPDGAGQPGGAGDLVLGEPQAELGLDIPPARRIAARPGTLVLFPSWMWHGTAPFAATGAAAATDRLTIAFDVRRLRG